MSTRTVEILKTLDRLPADWTTAIRGVAAVLLYELGQADAITAARVVAELARELELDPDVLADLVRREEES